METVTQTRNPLLAAIFNYLSWGTGYAYVGIRNPHGLPWMLGTVAMVVYMAIGWVLGATGAFIDIPTDPFTGYPNYFAIGPNWLSLALYELPNLLIGLYLAFDVRKMMKRGRKGGTTPSIAAMSKCPKCSSPISAADEFCPECGLRLTAQPSSVSSSGTSVSPSAKRCVSCGTYNPENYGFCQRCGGRL